MSTTASVPFSGVTVTTTTETILGATPVIPVNNPSAEGVMISGVINVSIGTGTTAAVVRVRAGNSLTGTIISVGDNVAVTAGATTSIPYCKIDTSMTLSPGAQYCVTLQQTGATGNATVNQGTISFDPVTQFVG